METRFTAAVLGALGLHAALIALTLSNPGDEKPAPVAAPRTRDVEVALLDEALGGGDERGSAAASGRSEPVARLGLRARGSKIAAEPVDSGEGTATQEPGAPAAPSLEQPPKIDLGLDGSIMRAEVLDASRRPPPPRKRVMHDDWSAVAVQIAAEQTGPREGSALLTLEWDADGRLQSVVASSKEWNKLADKLRGSVAQRPRSERGLRLVYVVKSEIVQPHHQRSVLPKSEYATFEKVEDPERLLPPVVTFNVGVKADTSIPGERVVSVTLANSQVL